MRGAIFVCRLHFALVLAIQVGRVAGQDWVAVVVSARVFSWCQHRCGEPFDRAVFVYRAMAGVLLGVLMWRRGYGVCV